MKTVAFVFYVAEGVDYHTLSHHHLATVLYDDAAIGGIDLHALQVIEGGRLV